MGFFNFIESFFFISLAITFVLIMMIIYHFKERINVIEKKTETTIEILNNLAKELTGLRGFVLHMNANPSLQPSAPSVSSSPFFQMLSSDVMNGFLQKNNINIDLGEDDEDDEDDHENDENNVIQINQLNIGEELSNSDIEYMDDGDDDDGDDGDDESESSEEEEEDKKETFESEIQMEKIVVLDDIPTESKNEDIITSVDLDIAEMPVSENVANIANVANVVIPPIEDYNKLTTTQLKNIVLDKKVYQGNVNKLKRPDLLKLLGTNA